MDRESGEINEGACQFSSTGNSRTAISSGDNEIADSNPKIGSGLEKAVVEGKAAKTEGEDKCSSHVIDVNCDNFLGESQRVCRICHLNAKESGRTSFELIELGCGCKGELGVAHLDCAEAWFRVKGNRLCEICSEIAKNIVGMGDIGFMEEWTESQSGDTISGSSERNRRCLRGQPLCNFLMACLVIAFVLPWFFRVNMF